MSLKTRSVLDVPKMTQKVARAAFPNGNVYMGMRDELGPLYEDTDFRELFPSEGQPAECPWRLALVMAAVFHRADCRDCPARSRCTHSKASPRELTLLPKEEFLA